MSVVSNAVYVIIAALLQIPNITGPVDMYPQDSYQQYFIDQYYHAVKDEVPLVPGLESIASDQASAINEFMAERGYTIKLRKFISGEFGVAAVMDFPVSWKFQGEITDLNAADDTKQEVTYPAVKMKPEGVRFYAHPLHRKPIIEILTADSSVSIFVTEFRFKAKHEFPFIAMMFADEMMQGCKIDYREDGLIFPMVNLRHKGEISWVKGMKVCVPGDTTKIKGTIAQAFSEVILKWNEKGIVWKSVAAMSVSRGGGPSYEIIDEPFIAWVQHKNANKPIDVVYVPQEYWQNPGELELNKNKRGSKGSVKTKNDLFNFLN